MCPDTTRGEDLSKLVANMPDGLDPKWIHEAPPHEIDPSEGTILENILKDEEWDRFLDHLISDIDDPDEMMVTESEEVSDFFATYFLWDLYSGYHQGGDKQVCHVTYDLGDSTLDLTYIKGDSIILPDNPVKSPRSVYSYTFSHWEGYTPGMTAESDCTITAVFDRHVMLDDYKWYVYVVLALFVLAAVALGCWYLRHGRN